MCYLFMCQQGHYKKYNNISKIIKLNFFLIGFKGIVLAQLVLKAISLLEAAGTQIDGVVSDGAQTNRRMWSEFGVSGDLNNIQNYTIHPMNPTRKLFFF